MPEALRRLRAALDRIGPRRSDARLAAESEAYWTGDDDRYWRSNSHFRGAPAFADDPTLWERVGRDHRALTQELARGVGWAVERPRVVEWGCGGGANAVAFAPDAGELVLVDLTDLTLREAADQVGRVSDVPVTTVRTEVDAPEAVLPQLGEVDLFLCFYVMELVPSPAHGRRILEVAARALRPGGLAVVQFKYDDGERGHGSRRRGYVRGLAEMTTWSIPDFWAMAAAAGLTPHQLALVPHNDLDDRYAYLAMTRD